MLLVFVLTALVAVAECESWLKRSLEYQEIPILSRSATMISGRGFRPGKRSSPVEVIKYPYNRRRVMPSLSESLPWTLALQQNHD